MDSRYLQSLIVVIDRGSMAQSGADFEKGEDDGTVDALSFLGSIVGSLAER